MFDKIINIVKDNFKAADFEISSQMMVKTLQKEFKQNFGLSLRIYEVGTGFAPPDKRIGHINNVNTKAEGFKIKATWKSTEVNHKFLEVFNLKVRVSDLNDDHLIPDDLTLGAAARGEYTKPKTKPKNDELLEEAKSSKSVSKPEKVAPAKITEPKKEVEAKTGGKANLNVNPNMKVSSLKKQFNEAFGGHLRVYKGSNVTAEDSDTLSQIRKADSKGGEISVLPFMLVSTFEAKFTETFGIKVKVAEKDNKALAKPELKLSELSK